jgi:hypothetical protein
MSAPIFLKSKEEALPDIKNWYSRTLRYSVVDFCLVANP